MNYPLEATPDGGGTTPLGFCYHRTPSGVRIELEDGPMRKRIIEEQFERVRQGDTSLIDYVPYVGLK
jgi:hypothetical protein